MAKCLMACDDSLWIIAASGPSLRLMPTRPKGWHGMAVNSSWQMMPWADVLYAGDWDWWRQYGDDAMSCTAEKYTRDERAAKRHRAKLIDSEDGRGLCTRPGTIHTGGNSGYQAINLAYHLGAREIVLVGYDMRHVAGRAHWHPDHLGLNSPERHIRVWLRNFDQLAADLLREGVRVTNATPGSALRCFPFGPLPC